MTAGEKKSPIKVMLLALSDDYWTPFVNDMAKALSEAGMEPVMVVDSRAGEYQCHGRRLNTNEWNTYYFSDFLKGTSTLKKIASNIGKSLNQKPMFCDFYRLSVYGADATMKRIDWNKLKSEMADFFAQIIQTERISLVLHDQVSTSFSYICYLTAKAHNVKYLGLVGARVPGRYEARESIYDDWIKIKETYQGIRSGINLPDKEEACWARDYLENIDRQMPSYMNNNFLNSVKLNKYINKDKFFSYANKIKYHLQEREEINLMSFREPPLTASHRSFSRNIKRLLLKKYFEKIEDNPEKSWLDKISFFVYPIHYQPEASTSIGSPEFVNQLDFIRNVAFNLPPTKWLLVKEHQSAIGYHSKHFYDHIKLLPNVLLIGPKWSIKELIRKSDGVITLTSTAGMESLLLNKPVYLFGSVFYQLHPLCKKVASWEEFSSAMDDPTPTDSYDNMAFLVAYRRHTREGVIDYGKPGWGIQEDLIALIKESTSNSISGR